MIGSHVHPRIEARRLLNLENRKNLLLKERDACRDKLTAAINSLKTWEKSEMREVVCLLIGVYEWALIELKTIDSNSSTDIQRLAAIGKLLKRCQLENDPQRSIAPEDSVCQ